jgi:hypothetical protein
MTATTTLSEWDAQIRLRMCFEKLREAEGFINRLLPQAFPQGAWVEWKHGSHTRRAEVIGHGYGRLQVWSENGRRYWIDVRRVLR